jgi:hypothetical protein
MKNLHNDTEQAGVQTTLFLLEDFLVNHTQPLESDLEKKMIATSGLRCVESYGRFAQHGSWAKMFSALLIGMTGWYSTRCRLTWKLKGTRYNRMYFQLQVLVRPTDEIEYGLLPTPCVADTEGSPKRADQITLKRGRYVRTSDNTGTEFGAKLNDVARLLPTPTVMPRLLPTPTSVQRDRGKSNLGEEMSELAFQTTGTTSQLNPQFVAEMMGFPPNYLELPFLSTETSP